MTYVITDVCIGHKDKSCVRECPVDCIYEGEQQLFVNPNECIDCGACEVACPFEAVFYEAELAEEQASAAERQAEIFAGLGRLGGARRYGHLPAGI